MKKAWETFSICCRLFMARTFGQYQHSTGGPGEPNVAKYLYKGKVWWIPTTAVEDA